MGKKKLQNIIILLLLMLIAGGVGYFIANRENSSFHQKEEKKDIDVNIPSDASGEEEDDYYGEEMSPNRKIEHKTFSVKAEVFRITDDSYYKDTNRKEKIIVDIGSDGLVYSVQPANGSFENMVILYPQQPLRISSINNYEYQFLYLVGGRLNYKLYAFNESDIYKGSLW